MNCPGCNEDALQIRTGRGPDTGCGHFDEDYATCLACGEDYPLDDLDRFAALPAPEWQQKLAAELADEHPEAA